MNDLVAVWNVPLSDNNYCVEFFHGTISGKRVIRVNKQEVLHRDWMFKLVGSEHFTIGPNATKCEIRIDTCSGFTYEYSLKVNGKLLQTFKDEQRKQIKTWMFINFNKLYRIVLEQEQLNVWTNGQQMKVEHVFIDNGTEIQFNLNELKHDSVNEIPVDVKSKSIKGHGSRKNSQCISLQEIDPLNCAIQVLSSGNKREGIVYKLSVNAKDIPECHESD